MTIILTNDDGIDAPGIKALIQAVQGQNFIIAAPRDHQSGCGHQVTTTRPITLDKRSEKEYAIAGTPADCVRIAISQISQDIKFVLSGINAGGNLGVDAYISGTVAAVREAAMNGIPGIAISHYRKAKQNFDWEIAAKLTAQVLDDLLQRPLEPGYFWNVNLPHIQPGEPEPKMVFCQPCNKALPINYRVDGNELYYAGEYGKRDRTPGSDVDICFSGDIAVTQLRV
ncbi:5'/3'-nucleotidase SurE [Nostoc sp. FACHB-110]|uniref:5'/3'-nucleotidase SurE n=1 Tax=Nostoc sp. FACHB-110 TaxID=2692834 RepID=UPI001683E30E|nr:5'/3'-nucleotidase SurE [Nostoc sp. FACHB-110]MBD2438146.1 5'/3'-nucleotidase SurE [Nostoc sp. FACHB-110]